MDHHKEFKMVQNHRKKSCGVHVRFTPCMNEAQNHETVCTNPPCRDLPGVTSSIWHRKFEQAFASSPAIQALFQRPCHSGQKRQQI
jgi:hypothetical protein